MKSSLTKYKDDLKQLIDFAEELRKDLNDILERKTSISTTTAPGLLFRSNYQCWYSEALEVIRQILPSRLDEFEKLYHGEPNRKILNGNTYTIRDWLLGRFPRIVSSSGRKEFNDTQILIIRFINQKQILESAKLRFESSLFDIKQIIQADLFDSEIDSSRELLKNGFLRAAGAVAGVVVEKHLKQVCENHKINIVVKEPTINTYNDSLKTNGVIDVPDWRFIQRIGDLRNLCDHNKQREPRDDEVEELIDDVEKLIKTIF